jgi:carbohydrate-selective porin OprB
MKYIIIAVFVTTIFCGVSSDAHADELTLPSWYPQILGGQADVIGQHMPAINSPYEGPNSLKSGGKNGRALTYVYGLYLGAQIMPELQAYMDVEMARGYGISNAIGMAAFNNGDIIRQGSALGNGPYVARVFLKYSHALGADTEKVSRDIDQLPVTQATNRVDIKMGRMAASDDFDQNRYANSTRTQFLNWGFINNTAWDFAADTRGYSNGVLMNWVSPAWEFALGSYQMPTQANGNLLDSHLSDARGDNAQVTFKPAATQTVIRLLVYRNVGRMGCYAQALDIARQTSTTPTIVATDKLGNQKTGMTLNIEQPLADNGETGVFMRVGWNDGKTEDFAYTEADRHFSAGLQLAGNHWGRDADKTGFAYLSDGLSAGHKDYLAAGGKGFMLGDGQLNYGLEQVLEAYYRVQLGRYAQLTPDVQYAWNPGYNKDRGPAVIYSLRLRLSF